MMPSLSDKRGILTMSRSAEVSLKLAMPITVLMATLMVATVFRYEVHHFGGLDLVQDRWAGTLSACRSDSRGYSGCVPYLTRGMTPISKSTVMSDEEFNRLLENAKP